MGGKAESILTKLLIKWTRDGSTWWRWCIKVLHIACLSRWQPHCYPQKQKSVFGCENLCDSSRNDCIFVGFFGYDPSNLLCQIVEDCAVQDSCFNNNGASLCTYEGMWFDRAMLVSYFWVLTEQSGGKEIWSGILYVGYRFSRYSHAATWHELIIPY